MKEIKVCHFSVKRGSFILKPLSLTIEKGEIFAILGRTGSGKTVLLEAMGGMFPGDSGQILYNGVDVMELAPSERSLGFVYQDRGLFPHMKVIENIAYGLKMHKYPKERRKKRVEELLELLSISHIRNQYPGTLSGGECQRTALARALALEPEVLLLDEPFSALDPSTKRILYQEIQDIHDRFPCTIVFVTHDFTEAQLLADRVGILLDGELLVVTKGTDLMQDRYCDKVELFLGRKV